MKIAVSACLLGYNCKYDGGNNYNQRVYNLMDKHIICPICPEVYGGLTTPRSPSEIQMSDKEILNLLNKEGKDVTENFVLGANKALELCKLKDIKVAILKSKSPSCGCGIIYDGSFTGKLISGDGVTAKLFKENGIKIYNENDEWKLE